METDPIGERLVVGDVNGMYAASLGGARFKLDTAAVPGEQSEMVRTAVFDLCLERGDPRRRRPLPTGVELAAELAQSEPSLAALQLAATWLDRDIAGRVRSLRALQGVGNGLIKLSGADYIDPYGAGRADLHRQARGIVKERFKETCDGSRAAPYLWALVMSGLYSEMTERGLTVAAAPWKRLGERFKNSYHATVRRPGNGPAQSPRLRSLALSINNRGALRAISY